MDDLANKTLLYDFYGEMLTKRQQEIYEDYYLNDLSFGEISEELGISRPAVHDNLKRSGKALSNYENKLKLIERYQDNKKVLMDVLNMTQRDDKTVVEDIRQIITDFIAKM